MQFWKRIVVGIIAALAMAWPVAATERAIIVLDGSGSMWAQIDGQARITIARETLAEVLSILPDELELGLMTYGHRERGNCADIEMLVQPATGTGAAIAAAADALNPRGMTPISDAVRLAAEELRFTEERATVILITDGLETCDVDPCQLATDLESQGVDFTTHVLGFGLSDEEGQQVACLAENTGGRYLSAADGDALVDALATTVAEVVEAEPEPAPEPEPVLAYNLRPTVALSEGGLNLTDSDYDVAWTWYEPAADGSAGEYVGTDYGANFEGSLEPGDYVVQAEVGVARLAQPVTIVDGEVAEPHFVLNAARLRLHPRPTEGADVDADASTEIQLDGEYLAYVYGDVDIVVPAGTLEAIVSIGESSVTRSFAPAAGDVIDEDVVLGVGVAAFAAEYVAGMALEADIFLEVFGAAVAIDGTRQSVVYGYGGTQEFELPAGDYVVAYRIGGVEGEVQFSVVTAERTEVPVVLDAGILAITTPSDDFIEIFGATADIAGNRESFGNSYGPSFQTTLPAGDYVVTSRSGDLRSETPVSIVAGERFELSVEYPEGETP